MCTGQPVGSARGCSTWNRCRWDAAPVATGAAGARGGPLIGYLAAALGGALGSLARWGLGRALPHPVGAWPTATLLINLSGCLVLGVLAVALFTRHPRSPWLRPFLGTGVLGGWTTFSTFAVDTVQLADAGRGAAAVGYVLASVVGGVLAAAAGVRLGRVLGVPREPRR
ncbi:fluoride efflux transporter CrcB [Modestobacter sp. L9-4]|uniref:fluoride efflux transporter CrcB n=1 Tax=Modestobacter sp. L9-4 TaxID=2851567 RepID=UPI001F01AA47|nr:fluoride efflux transporter CrcB [Modestobacter sp. L9-4]